MDRHQPRLQKRLSWLLRPVVTRPGLCVLVLVMLLLKGVSGTVNTLLQHSIEFVGSFLDGGSSEIAEVLRQTAPLALSVAVIVLAVLRRWLPSDARGVFAAALVILGGAWLGNELRYGGQTIQPAFETSQFHGWIGTVLSAGSQLAGYLREYRPNLFLASLAVGAYLGWRCEGVLMRIEGIVKPSTEEPSLKVPRKRSNSTDERRAA